MKKLIYAIFLMIFISSCAPVPTSAPTTIAPPSATLAPMPTEVAPSMENLPAEWAGRIDRVETMTEMDGVTTRVVAILKSDDPDKEAQLRTLQWDADAGEWVEYVPQVGKISGNDEWWDSTDVDELPVAELQARMNQERVYGKDGQEIGPGLVADFRDATLLSGDVVGVVIRQVSIGQCVDQIVAIPKASGDIELMYIGGSSPNSQSTYSVWPFEMASVDPKALATDASLGEQSMTDAVPMYLPVSPQRYWGWMLSEAQQNPYRRIVFAMSKKDTSIDGGNDSPAERQNFATDFSGDQVINTEHIYVMLDNYTVLSQEDYDAIGE